MEKETVIRDLATQLGLELRDNSRSYNLLLDTVNEWLQHDFNRLVQVLYRMDVSENKLRKLLKDRPGEDAAGIIVNLMIERQLEKMESRRKFTPKNPPGDTEEKW